MSVDEKKPEIPGPEELLRETIDSLKKQSELVAAKQDRPYYNLFILKNFLDILITAFDEKRDSEYTLRLLEILSRTHVSAVMQILEETHPEGVDIP